MLQVASDLPRSKTETNVTHKCLELPTRSRTSSQLSQLATQLQSQSQDELPPQIRSRANTGEMPIRIKSDIKDDKEKEGDGSATIDKSTDVKSAGFIAPIMTREEENRHLINLYSKGHIKGKP
eukprot:Pgem_evm1s13175